MDKQPCENRAEWRLQGKAAVRLSSYYQLGCDYGTALMISWENGGAAPIYLCESHGNQVGPSRENGDGVLTTTPPSVRSNHATEQLKSPIPPAPPSDAQVGLEKKDLAVAKAPASELTSSDSHTVLADEPLGNMPRENFEAYGTVLKLAKPSTATEETQPEYSNLVHVCSRYAERCSYEATVHCPKCGKWFCDGHAEDGNWHPCVLTVRK